MTGEDARAPWSRGLGWKWLLLNVPTALLAAWGAWVSPGPSATCFWMGITALPGLVVFSALALAVHLLDLRWRRLAASGKMRPRSLGRTLLLVLGAPWLAAQVVIVPVSCVFGSLFNGDASDILDVWGIGNGIFAVLAGLPLVVAAWALHRAARREETPAA